MIRVTIEWEQARARVCGHAEFAPEGSDIVCAGVSALMNTMALVSIVEAQKKGEMAIKAAGDKDKWRDRMAFIEQGLKQIVRKYPQCVMIEDRK